MIYTQEEFYYFVHDSLDYITICLDNQIEILYLLVSIILSLLVVALAICFYYLFWRRR